MNIFQNLACMQRHLRVILNVSEELGNIFRNGWVGVASVGPCFEVCYTCLASSFCWSVGSCFVPRFESFNQTYSLAGVARMLST